MQIKENPDAKPYSVVFRYNEKAGGYDGVITWTNFADKAEFDKWWSELDIRNQDIVAQGVAPSDAILLVKTTSPSAYLLSALQEATHEEKVSVPHLKAQLATVLYAIEVSNHSSPIE